MELKNQFIAIGMMAQGMIKVEADTGLIYGNGHLLTPNEINGYLQYTFNMGHSGGIFSAYGHCLVYLTTYGTYNPKYVIDHIDRDRGNNSLSNLRCCTQADNVSRTYTEGTRKPYKSHIQQRKLPTDAHKMIYDLNHNGMSFCGIAEKMGCSRQTASRIAKKYFKTHIQPHIIR